MKKPGPKQIAALKTSLVDASAGKIPWLDALIVEAGYLPNPRAMSARAIAVLWEVTPQAVGLWHKREHCPRNPDGTYDLVEVIRWQGARAKGGHESLPAGYRDWKQYWSAQTEELEYRKAVGELIPKDEVENGRRARLIALTRGLENMGSALAGRLGVRSPQEIQAAIDDYVRHLRAEFARGEAPEKEEK